MSLAWVDQDDFAAGVLSSASRPTWSPASAFHNALNGLFDDDGDVYVRGNTDIFTDPLPGPVTFLWTGDLLGGPVGLICVKGFGYYALHGNVATPLSGGALVDRPVKPAVVAGVLYLPNGDSWRGSGPTVFTNQLPAPIDGMGGSVHLAACGERLVIGQGRYVRFSEAGNPSSFLADDYHELPEGARVRGLATIKDTLLVFTGYGIWSIENMALDLTDDFGNPQQVVQKLYPELALLHEAGLAEWGGRIVAPCGDRILLVDTISAPTPISDSITPLYIEHVRAGRLPGGAKVYRSHYFLPWLDPDGVPVSTLACRMNRPVRGRMTYYPWSILSGHCAKMTTGDISAVSDVTTLLVGSHEDALHGLICDYGHLFEPSGHIEVDADGSVPEFDLETRDFPTGNGQPNHLRALRLYYTLESQGTDASIEAAFSYGSTGQNYEQLATGRTYADVDAEYPDYAAVVRGGLDADVWGPGEWAAQRDRFWVPLDGKALDSGGIDPQQWILDQPKRVRYARVRFRCQAPVAKLIVHRIGFGIRPATHQR